MRSPLLHAAALVLLVLAPARAAVAAPSALPGPVYTVDGAHSIVGFAARYMGVVDVRGSFPDVNGTLVYVPGAIERSTITVVIGTPSLATGHKLRDADLRGPEFFDTARFPVARFSSRRVVRRGESLVMVGDLTIRNVTKEVAVRFSQIHPPVTDAFGVTRVGFAGGTRISRLDFGVVGSRSWNSEFSPGRFAIADSVDIELTLEARLAGAAPAGAAARRSAADSLVALEATGGAPALAQALRTGRRHSLAALREAVERMVQAGRADGALEAARHAVERFGSSAEAHEALALAHAQAGSRELALASTERALTLDPLRTAAREIARWMRTP